MLNPAVLEPPSNVSTRVACERLAEIITSLQRCFIQNISRHLARGNVSFPQYLLLGFLEQQEFLTMSDIAKRMGHTTAAATGLVDRLETVGLVQRNHAQDDRRKIRVHITEKGLALVAEIREDMTNNLQEVMGILTDEEQRYWVQIYEKIFAFVHEK